MGRVRGFSSGYPLLGPGHGSPLPPLRPGPVIFYCMLGSPPFYRGDVCGKITPAVRLEKIAT